MQLFMHRFPIGFKNQREDYRVGETVGDIVFSAQGVCDGVDISHVRFGKCAACVERGVKHISSGINIFSVVVYGIDIFEDETHRQKGVLSGAVGGGIADICFLKAIRLLTRVSARIR